MDEDHTKLIAAVRAAPGRFTLSLNNIGWKVTDSENPDDIMFVSSALAHLIVGILELASFDDSEFEAACLEEEQGSE